MTPSAVLSRRVLAMIYNYLKSNATLRINDSFKINAKVLSVRHANDLEKRKKPWKRHTHFGARKVGSKDRQARGPRREKWKFPVENGYPGKMRAFENKCLLVALTVAYNNALYLEGSQDHQFFKMKKILLKNAPKKAKEAGLLIEEEIHNLCQTLDISKEGPHCLEDFFDKLSDLWNCQIHLFSAQSKGLWKSFPKDMEETKRQLYLSANVRDESVAHVDVIVNLVSYYLKFGKSCVYCKKHHTGMAFEHCCKERNFCRGCHRYILRQDTYVNQDIIKMFCKPDEDFGNIACESCNGSLKSNSCKAYHKQKVCFREYTCKKCNACIQVSGKRQKNDIVSSHVCGKKSCQFCHESIEDEPHLCKLSTVSYQKEWCNLAFLQMEAVAQTPSHCKSCFEKGTTCDECAEFIPSSEDQVNLCILYYESEKRGSFDRKVLAEFSLPPESTFKKNAVVVELPGEMEKVPLSKRNRYTNYGQEKKKRVEKNTFQNASTVPEQLMDYIVTLDMKNTTVIVHGGQSYDMNFIVKALLCKGLDPHIVMKDQKIFLIDLPGAGVRFIDSENYLEESDLPSLGSNFFSHFRFFPHRMNNPNFYDYVGKAPSLINYWEFEDTPDRRKEKKKYVDECALDIWVFKEELLAHCDQKVRISLLSCIDFMRQAYICQEALREELRPCPPTAHEMEYYHPFSLPHITKTGYAYNLFRLFCRRDLRNVRIVKNENSGVPFRSSRGELEYCSYLKRKYGNPESFIFGFSPYGQMYFKECVPDYYYKETAGFWHGCNIHFHSAKICPKMKGKTLNCLGKTEKECHDEFAKKINLLKAKHPEVKKIDIMYECEWNQKKLNDPEVQSIMKDYEEFPPFRLNPRVAGSHIRMTHICKMTST